ncbi:MULTISPECIES: iron-sulfur cluster insertion protein ErpA [Thalassospira]|jgi:iron-sulfur cluster insertion protein|uniref:Iron-sulfur cluster assembly accessory protein n=1 Tax=Thalassospira povalilytica TaxID=732237 RepID=A0A8I1M8B4_9PROT|nr:MULTISPECIES: iron-sulfur cluster insertion protein ErpA [Thalassospira]MEE3044665.1 iron-sulfur cluster insertion protein ErpA [Pseudomonadota bacterium]RCK24813.1 heme biosynthesis protein HemY [Thalassospira profundimaris]KZB60879.1 heme biosynthesis protein HemY [Thalassospira sp. MCCC 1A02491]MAL39207.1 iron-sulfur cluster assembly accessory protein [Thalassospira sp.]MBN8197218.1 iron-sulfur cluster insertion protein ErpA [Thalassospira povalilytica]|tara:strand:+ start:945 stop:1286 length:342 start_codon:yes stop_codon:yes gene_type:complete
MTEASRQVQMTESAAKRIQELIASEGAANTMLRLQVSGGGCSGFQYEFSLDSDTTDEDCIFENYGAKMVIDEVSLDLLGGAEIDFVREMVGSAFRVNNPNATSSCGCGSSFSI